MRTAHVATFSLMLFIAAVGCIAYADDADFRPLFNGRDLTGWVNVNCAPSTWSVREGIIVSTGKPTGILRSDKQHHGDTIEFTNLYIKED